MTQDSRRPDVGAQHWRSTLIAVCIAQATAIVGFDFTLPFIPLYLQHDLGVHGIGQTALWAGLISFGPAIPATIFGPIWGRLADRLGYRVMLLRAIVCAAILLACMGLVPSAGVLLALRMIQGALTGTVYSAQALVAASVPEREIGRSMGLLQMSVYIGATFGPVAGGIVAELLGYRAAFAGAGILLAGAAVVVFLFVHEPPLKPARAVERSSRPSFVSVLLVPSFAGALVLTMVVQLSNTALFPIVPLFVQDLLHSGRGAATATGWVMAFSGVTAAAGSYLAGRLQRHVGLKPLIVAALMLSVALLIPQAFSGSYVAFLLLRGAAAFSVGALFGLVGVWAAVSSPREAKGTAFGLLGAASSLGFGAGPLAGGAITAMVGIRPVFVIAAVSLGLLPAVLFGSAAAISFARRTYFARGLHSVAEGE
jgi:DHA1 family multidrug resistance protein-like MFS transporter